VTNRQTQTTPGRALWVMAKLILGLAAFGAMIWRVVVADGPADAGQAALLALLAKVFLDSGVADVLALGRAEQERALAAAENTGVWKNAEGGNSFTVRYEPRRDAFWVSGWISQFYELTVETEVASHTALRTTIEEAEREGMVPEDDEATRSIRARLMVANWDQA
jgi:hypothetical protein